MNWIQYSNTAPSQVTQYCFELASNFLVFFFLKYSAEAYVETIGLGYHRLVNSVNIFVFYRDYQFKLSCFFFRADWFDIRLAVQLKQLEISFFSTFLD